MNFVYKIQISSTSWYTFGYFETINLVRSCNEIGIFVLIFSIKSPVLQHDIFRSFVYIS